MSESGSDAAMTYPSDSAALILSDCLTRIDMEVPARRAFKHSRPLYTIACRLADVMSDVPDSPFSNRKLLDISMEHAINAYYNDHESVEAAAQRFVRALVNRATDLLGVEVSTVTNSWNPLGADTLTAFLSSNPDARLHYRPVDESRPHPGDYRRHLSNQLLTQEDIEALGLDVEAISNPPD